MKKLHLSVFIIIITLTFLSPLLNAQISFLKTYGDSLYNEGTCVLQTSDSGYVVTSSTQDYIEDPSTSLYRKIGSIQLMKTDKYGDSVWTKTYTFKKSVSPGQILQTEGGEFIISGCLAQDTTPPLNLLIRTDSKGDTLWTRTYGKVSSWGRNNLLQLKNGSFILSGIFDSTYNEYYPTIIKIDNNGLVKWAKRYTQIINRMSTGITETPENGFMLALEGSAILKTDSLGNLLWHKYLIERDPTMEDGGADFDLITRTQDNGYYLIGNRTVKHKTASDLEHHLMVIKLNSEGDTLWAKKLGRLDDTDWGYGTFYPNSYDNLPDGGLIISGSSDYPDFLLRMDAEGNEVWMKYNLVREPYPCRSVWRSVKGTYDGGFIAAGYKRLSSEAAADIILLKTDGNGNITGVHDAGGKKTVASSFKLDQNYPNPFNPSTRITYNLDKEGNVDLSIYNMLGEKITTLVKQQQFQGSHSYDLNISSSGISLQSGIYIYVLKTEHYYAARKMAIIK
ncbi:MAG: T9SS type A sorting domain-containing protein [Ignavibacteria bacterium]|jgi:hypothetical protein|nr:T9SS type A sorting domain-containing protein [Ignavibacteria bacterium]HEX2962564.1 T9SS type A sorting domain-containing protein [Ignavibacteriales bacterium]MCU7500143.1 T9SS type A sorting domain-containing protein [Ignavibacteria bacterium]MCU7511530.1 T9SS type A sorting domain-containing protein [Ignavibacteria bacterium]MCU7521035.1 T9SS type A sorting domain-containing protein [Ignavibacteria bacterium]